MIECPGCSSTSPLTELEIHKAAEIRYRLHACGACGLHFWEPRVMPSASYYEKSQEAESKARLYRHALIDYELRPYHREFFNAPPPPGKLLDIGCGDGKFLEAAQKKGFKVWGLDLDSKAIEVAAQRGLSDVFSCSLDQFIESSPPLFDVITIFEVLEHQADPASFIKKIKLLLNEGGMIFGSVPNGRRWKSDEDKRWDLPPHHFTIWTIESLQKFFYANELRASHIYDIHYGFACRYYYGKLAGYLKEKLLGNNTVDYENFLMTPLENIGIVQNDARIRIKAAISIKKVVLKVVNFIAMIESIFERRSRKGYKIFFRVSVGDH